MTWSFWPCLDTPTRLKSRVEIVSHHVSRKSSRSLVAVEYNMYMQLGVAGLRALENYNIEDGVCSPQHTGTL